MIGKLRKFTGVVTSVKQPTTVTVNVTRTVVHPKYGQRYLQSKNYLCHNELADLQEGESVTIVAARPRSKRKKWLVLNRVAK